MDSGVVAFYGPESPLSNFYPHEFDYEGFVVKSSEAAFMIAKALEFAPEWASRIAGSKTPMEAKKLGRQVPNFDEAVWDEKSYDAMVGVLMAKFSGPLKEVLLETGTCVLVEASPRDHKWGVGVGEDKAKDPTNWRGANLLGAALMDVRARLADTKEQRDVAARHMQLSKEYLRGMRERAAARSARTRGVKRKVR